MITRFEVFNWTPIAKGQMPKIEGDYLVAWSDGSVESYPISKSDIDSAKVVSQDMTGQYWTEHPLHPDESG